MEARRFRRFAHRLAPKMSADRGIEDRLWHCVRRTVLKSPVYGDTQCRTVDVFCGSKQRDVWKVFDPRVGTLAWQCVCVDLLGHMCCQRVDAKATAFDANEVEDAEQACEKTIKDKELAPALQVHSRRLSLVA